MCEWCKDETAKDGKMITRRCMAYWESTIQKHRHKVSKVKMFASIRVLRRELDFLKCDLRDIESMIETRREYLEDLLDIEEAEKALEDVMCLYDGSVE
jgi:Lhr-like helicase